MGGETSNKQTGSLKAVAFFLLAEEKEKWKMEEGECFCFARMSTYPNR